jgi:Leucine-rich repeat (LRR) protein
MYHRIWIIGIFCGVFLFVNKSSAQIARCDYKYDYFWTAVYKTTNASYYKCNLSTRQANYNEKLTTIDGQHENGQTDDDVKWIDNYENNILKEFSSIFCQKFPNLEVIRIDNAEVESIDEDSLSNCKNLEHLLLYGNKIREIPENLLIRSSKLTLLWIRNSQLTTLSKNLFSNQKELETLDLNSNQINFLPSNIFDPLLNLESFYLDNNKLQSIDPKWFVRLQNLKWLRLDGNQITEIPSKCFENLRNLEKLWIYDNKIKTLNSDSFHGLQNLKLLSLYNNLISDLSVGVFPQLKNLELLSLKDNNLTTIHSDSFGIHNKLTKINLQDNKINAIDEKFINNAPISILNMTNNICSNSMMLTKNEIKQNLKNCFDNYQPRIQQYQNNQNSIQCGHSKIGLGNIIKGTQINKGDFPW